MVNRCYNLLAVKSVWTGRRPGICLHAWRGVIFDDISRYQGGVICWPAVEAIVTPAL